MYNKWNILRKKEDDKSKEECKKIEDELANSYTKEFINMIEKESTNVDPEKGGFNSTNMWKIKKKMFPQSRDLPTAMLDQEGDIENIKSAAYPNRIIFTKSAHWVCYQRAYPHSCMTTCSVLPMNISSN